MSTATETDRGQYPRYVGLRLSADQYFELEDDGFRYELINGVMVTSPSPIPRHQKVLVELLKQISVFLSKHPVGEVLPDVDVKLDEDLLYRPDLVYIRRERLPRPLNRIDFIPDLIVEIISPSSQIFDRREKKQDYQRYGVREYWVIDPIGDSVTFYCREGDSFAEVEPRGDEFPSRVVTGFALDLSALRAAFRSI
jgi:Uma2 family endonuclease